jgi:hypothetical protein
MNRTRGDTLAVVALSIAVCAAACTPKAMSHPLARDAGTPRSPFTLSRLDSVDVLFVIDNSNSMQDEQASLRAEFPRLIDVLTRGERFPGDPLPFTPISHLHLGVVSTDLGLPGYSFGACDANGGGDGILQHHPNNVPGIACDASYPPYLSFDANSGQDPTKLANDFACIASIGTMGCGFEQQLEAPLKALWPSVYTNPQGQILTPNPIAFLGDETMRVGHGDTDNAGFLHNDPPDGPSLLVIVLLTDEDDCSMSSLAAFRKSQDYAPDSPYKQEDIDLRCFDNQDQLYDVQTRYLEGFRALRPGHEELVVFAAIAGVPDDLVSPEALAKVDFSDDAARDAFYAAILNDPRMLEAPDPATMPGSGQGDLKASCTRPLPDGTLRSAAFPPRRIVSLAQRFGQFGTVASICQGDFAPALSSIVDVMAKPLTEMCPQPLERRQDGTVDCRMLWQLPAAGNAFDDGVPTDCAELGDLIDPFGTPAELTPDSGESCEIRQLAVQNGTPSPGRGWYYDDTTPGLSQICSGGQAQRIAFAAGSRPPRGVAVKLECISK